MIEMKITFGKMAFFAWNNLDKKKKNWKKEKNVE